MMTMTTTTNNELSPLLNNTPTNANINLMKWETVKNKLIASYTKPGPIDITVNDVFRITKMAYMNNYLVIFLTGYVGNDGDKELYQFYVETKCDLYSYKFCYNNHASNTCRFNCKSHKAFVMPGVRDVYMEKFNVAKYKRFDKDDITTVSGHNGKQRSLDYFLRDINRVHMQTDLKEGQYVSFRQAQKCVNHRLKCSVRDLNAFKTLFRIVPMDTLKSKIVPVVVCYDIETHSQSVNQFSNASVDHVISISMVMNRDNVYTFVCLYYMRCGANDDLSSRNGDPAAAVGTPNDDKREMNEIMTVRFDNELDMLKAFFELLPLLNGDYLIDYNGNKFDLPYIIERWRILTGKTDNTAPSAKRTKMTNNNKNNRDAAAIEIKRYDLDVVDVETQTLHDKFNNKIDNHLLTYYVHVDLYQFLSSDSEHKNLENFQLNTVSKHYLHRGKIDLNYKEMIELYNAGCVRKIIEYNIEDSVLPIKLLLKLEIMEFLYTQCMLLYLCTDDLLSNISHKISVVFFHLCMSNVKIMPNGETVSDPFIFNKTDLSVTSGRRRANYMLWNGADDESSGNENVDLNLLKRKPIPIDKIPCDAVKLCSSLRPNCNYKGGKVLSPISGLKKWVVTLDFNSLYPTIMMYEGACFSNLFIGADDCVYLTKDTDAINPKLLRDLRELRQNYKNKRDAQQPTSFLYHLYDTLQNAVKRIANSIYGYFGIYFKVLANYITKIGRVKFMEAIGKIESMSDDDAIKQKYNLSKINFKVIYGDTDSSFIQVDFEEEEMAEDVRFATIEDIVKSCVLKQLNASWHGLGYKMALENVMSTLILLKKKKYCYINSDNRIKYKGWLIKKDMPLFMRKTFRAVVDSYLHNHSVSCGLRLLLDLMTRHYENFHNIGACDDELYDYGFSMSYNENSTTAKKSQKRLSSGSATRKPVVTIAKHCREILMQSGTKHLPGNGDRIPFLLIDIKGKITEKSYPLALFNPQRSNVRVSWLKHMNILCNFMNELIQIFGNRPEFEYYFEKICSLYMSRQLHDVKYPVLSPYRVPKIKKRENADNTEDDDDDDDDENDDDDDDKTRNVDTKLNFTHQFKMYVKKPAKLRAEAYRSHACKNCLKIC
ncbi:polymerase [Artaxa digramma nucleopolyhedrovirus]|uniref:DNA-directed DNA polymerase n=1 Tax=Artaxa digramma nucleopolyhedrovirus TaxID=3070910 RepID=A0AAE6V0G7_9ABAC|nr:polymerase [Euproctis digramma nucleopolyhedrovirus]QHB21729.1 polymerase [Artaxa digramma nucleopolyhedrovirus]